MDDLLLLIFILAAGASSRTSQTREEEEMTPYTKDDLQNDWEFKIVHSSTYAFNKPQALEQLIAEEAKAGWIMLEILDGNRVRFKRPGNLRNRNSQLRSEGIEPYRTCYGKYNDFMSERMWLLMFTLIALFALYMAFR